MGEKMPEFGAREGLALALSYIDDPSNVPCPACGPGTMEMVAYVDPVSIAAGTPHPAQPDGDYAVVLYCHNCLRAAALDFSRASGSGSDEEGLRDVA